MPRSLASLALARSGGGLSGPLTSGGGFHQPANKQPIVANQREGTYRCEVLRRAFPPIRPWRSK